jgi:serine/threonine-protein kinase RsbW
VPEVTVASPEPSTLPDPEADPEADADGEAPAAEIRVAIPADARFLRVARLTAAGIASDLGFSLQDIEDLRVAVDELCAVLMDGVAPSGQLELRYVIGDGTLEILGTCPALGVAPELHPVAAELLRMTADVFEIATDADGRSFRLVKHRHDLTV